MPKVADPLCPLGFHPQVRWPTRCKRCFREYKEHSNSTNRKESAESSSSSIRREDRSGSVDSLDDSKFDNIPTPVAPVRSRESVALSRRNTTEIPLLRDEAQGDARSSKNEKESEKSKDYGSIYSSIAGSAFSRLTKHRSSAALQDPSGASAIAKSSGEFEPSRRGSSGDESEKLRKKRVQIHSLKEVPSDSNYNSPDVQFILEVKRSNIKVQTRIIAAIYSANFILIYGFIFICFVLFCFSLGDRMMMPIALLELTSPKPLRQPKPLS